MISKRKKSSRFRGSHTHGRGFKKKARGSGHRGGVGMAGTGKRADQKKTLILNLPEKYFGKKRALRRGNLPPKLKSINVRDLQEGKDYSGYKVLGVGEAPKGIQVKAVAASAQALEKVKKAGGRLELSVVRVAEKKEVEKEE